MRGTLAKATGVSPMRVHRIWQAFGLQPHRTKTFKLSPDPLLIDTVRDIVGLYLNPPQHAAVFCVDDKPQIQALDRTAPLLPLRPGQAERRTHDYKRHGTTSLLAALEVKTGHVLGQIRRRHSAIEFRAFLTALEMKQLRRGVHDSVRSHESAIREFIDASHTAGQPYVWTKRAPYGSRINIRHTFQNRGLTLSTQRGALQIAVTMLKVLNPLFLGDLRAKLDEAGDNQRTLLNLRKRMAKIRVFDPACDPTAASLSLRGSPGNH